MANVPLPLPLRGLSDLEAFSRQSPDTTREGINVRSQDPTNGRVRIAQRAGMTLANTNPLVSGQKVAELCQVVFDNRNLTYDFTAGAESVEWQVAAPSGAADTLRGTVDDQGNVYALDGDSAIVKYNPDGAVVWQFPLPTQDEADIVRFLHVDDLGDVYAGVSDGRRQDLGRLWKITQLPEDKLEVAWTIELGAYVERGKVRQDKLYTAQNEPDTKTSWVRVYDALDAAEPQKIQEFLAPYPINGLDIKEDGSIITCHEEDGIQGATGLGSISSMRGPNPKFPNTTPVLVDWTPYDLPDWDARIWRWHAPEDIGEFDVGGELVDFADVLRWPDRTNNGRDLLANLAGGDKAPKYIKRAQAVWPGVRFNGTDEAMRSEANPSISDAYRDQQKTLFPGYTNSMFTVFIVCRPENVATSETILFQDHPGTDHSLIANETSAGAATAGEIRHEADTDAGDPGAGTGGQPLEATYTSETDVVLVTIQYCGGVETGNNAATRSHFRVNGDAIDRYEGDPNTTLVRSLIGSDGTSYFRGDILEIIVVDRRLPPSAANNLEANYNGGNPNGVGGGKVLSHELHPDIPAADQSDNEMTRFEGYLAHKFGITHLLPNAAATLTHPSGRTTGDATYDPGPPPDFATSDHRRLGSVWPLVAKWSPAGALVWSINNFDLADQDGDVSADRVSGLGHDVIVNSDGNIYSIGPQSAVGTPEPIELCMLIDEGDTVSADVTDGAWAATVTPTATAYNLPQLAIDKFDNVYVPVSNTTNTLRVYSSTGTLISDVTITGREATAIAVDPRVPDYEGDLTDELAEFVYAFSDDGGTAGDPTVHRVRLVTASALAGSPRQFTLLGVAGNGGIRTFEVDGGAPAEPTGASGALSASARFFRCVPIQGEVVLTDGISELQVYSPRDDAVTTLESNSSGRPPHRSQILEKWNDRLFAARAVGLLNEAFAWQFSKKGDFRNWDNFPPDRDPSAAIGSANLVGPGLARDIINGFCPFSDDVAIFLCDHSAWWLTGDPGDGGEWDLLSDEWGGAFGRAWAKDPDGNAYIFGSRGGLYRIRAGSSGGQSAWERLTLGNIERRLRAIDFSTYYIRMAWNDDDEGIHVFQMPFGNPSTIVDHWFWDTKVIAPWEDVIGNSVDPGVLPTAVLGHDADDPDDRTLLIGCRDGFVRRWDKDAKDDNGVAIDARVLLGSLASGEVQGEMRFVGPQIVLADEQDGASYELFAGDEPTVVGTPIVTGGLGPGRNNMKRSRVRGSYCYVRILNANRDQRFAIEEAAIMAYPAGRKRVRNAD